MGLFTPHKPRVPNEDPLDPFTLPDFAALEPSRAHLNFKALIAALRPYRYALAMLVGLVAMWGWMSRHDQRKDPFVFIELRAIDPSGHPVAGARVDFGGMVKGVTDSFGEWRRYLRLKPGSRVVVRLQKDARQGRLVASKALEVPEKVPRNREPEIKSSIQLAAGPVATEKVGTAAPAEVSEARAPAVITAQSSDGGVFGRVALTLKMPTAGALSEVGEKESRGLEKIIYPQLKRKFEAEGVRLDPVSPWQVALQYVPLAQGSGFVRAEVRTRHGGEALTFLRQMPARPEDAVHSILDLVRLHTPVTYTVEKRDGAWYVANANRMPKFWQLEGGEVLKDRGGQTFPLSREVYSRDQVRVRLITAGERPCAGDSPACTMKAPTVLDTPPMNGWRLLKFKLEGRLAAQSMIFLSGYQARRGPDGLYHYWGEPLTGANLTVVGNGRVTFRQRIQDQTDGLPVVRMASEPIARR